MMTIIFTLGASSWPIVSVGTVTGITLKILTFVQLNTFDFSAFEVENFMADLLLCSRMSCLRDLRITCRPGL